MENDKKKNFNGWVGILVGVFAILAIKSIFEDDNSKIISKEGRKVLSDKRKMEDINKKIMESEDKNEHKEVFI